MKLTPSAISHCLLHHLSQALPIKMHTPRNHYFVHYWIPSTWPILVLSRHLLNEWMIYSSENCKVFLNWACLGRLYLSIDRFTLMAIVPSFQQSGAQSNDSQGPDQTATLEGQSRLSRSLIGIAARAPLSSFLVGLTIWDLKLVFNILILWLWDKPLERLKFPWKWWFIL